MRYSTLTFTLSAMIIASSCSNADNNKGITSGRIDYSITYLNENIDSKSMELLPRRMKLVFNEKQAANNIEGFLGFYRINAFTDFHTRKCSTVLKVFDKNYLFKGKREEQMCCFDPMNGMEIKETGETKKIAGFNCKKSVVYLPSSGESFAIYYTDEIALRHPNATNPYRNVKGVLMEFELNLLHLKMRFVAEKYHAGGNEVLISQLPVNTRVVSRDQMTQILNKLMEE